MCVLIQVCFTDVQQKGLCCFQAHLSLACHGCEEIKFSACCLSSLRASQTFINSAPQRLGAQPHPSMLRETGVRGPFLRWKNNIRNYMPTSQALNAAPRAHKGWLGSKCATSVTLHPQAATADGANPFWSSLRPLQHKGEHLLPAVFLPIINITDSRGSSNSSISIICWVSKYK